jgi:hypothetical protein
MLGSVMPQAYFSSGPSLTSIERPRCSHCTSRMMLARISPGPIGFEQRRFDPTTTESLKAFIADLENRLSNLLDPE